MAPLPFTPILMLWVVPLSCLRELRRADGKSLFPSRQSEMTDRAPYATDTETEGEFEDARESLGGGVSPAVGPRASFASTTLTRSSSAHDFVSVRSAPSTGHGYEDEDEAREVLASENDFEEFRRTVRGGRPSSISHHHAISPPKPDTAEHEVQTESLETPVIEKIRTVYVDKIVHVDRPVVVEKIVYRDRPSTAPSSIASPSLLPDALDESAARASAFLDDRALPSRPVTPSNDLFASTRTIRAGLAPIDTRGKSRDTMAPPAVPSTSGRKLGSPRKSVAATLAPPPPRPTSPPPPDLLFRAQSPTFDDDYARRASFLAPPGANTVRSQPSSLTASPSSSRFAGPFSNLRNVRPQSSMDTSVSQARRPRSSSRHGHTSSARSVSELSVRSDVSRRLSMASEATSEGGFVDRPEHATSAPRGVGDSSDPVVIHAITQTMIGEFMHKYTRRKLGGGMSENRHKRFFWIHPYTKTLYWSATDPGAQSTTYSNSKSGTHAHCFALL